MKASGYSLSLNNGGEFAKSYASWLRGSNENTNGRIRRFWLKKFDMATLDSKIDIDEVYPVGYAKVWVTKSDRD